MSDNTPHHTPPATPTTRGAADVKSGQTQAEQDGVPVPKLPHERDESAEPNAGPADPESLATRVGKQAFDDVQRGVVDTDRGPAAERVYEKLKHAK